MLVEHPPSLNPGYATVYEVWIRYVLEDTHKHVYGAIDPTHTEPGMKS